MAQVRDSGARDQLCRLLDLATSDRVACWTLAGDCSWTRRNTDADGTPLLDYQELLITGQGRAPDKTALDAATSNVAATS
jgi:hypothetical protein